VVTATIRFHFREIPAFAHQQLRSCGQAGMTVNRGFIRGLWKNYT
jgi:hypothetical protein